MNSRGRWSILFGLAAAGSWLGSAAGCSDPGGELECTLTPSASRFGASKLFPDDENHWIIKDPSGNCSAHTDWKGTRVFGGGTPMGGIMATYCAYVWSGVGSPDFTPFMGLARARDLRGITPQTPTPTTVESWAHDTFVHGVALPTGAPALGPRVRVIVADTEQFGSGTAGINKHGALMAALVSEVACQGLVPCSVSVETELALPRRRDPSTNTEVLVSNGGDFGRRSDLVVAIDNALARWRFDSASGGPFPAMLALNLSLAFEKAPTPLPPNETFSADDMVLDALKAFSCHGGAIFAAAGNHGGLGSSQLMLPAAWQNLPGPKAKECAALLNGKSYDFYGTFSKIYTGSHEGNPLLHRPYNPTGTKPTPGFLLHAIGAFDQGGIPITKTREQACPRFGALGLGWSEAGTTSPILTGTSVPTAVVSGFFAAAMAQTTYGSGPGSITNPFIKAHPQTILDALAATSPTRAFGAEGPCEGPWSCDDIPWFGGTPSTMTTQNNPAGFPWLDYGGTVSPVLSIGLKTNCPQIPLCEQKAASAVAVIFPTPNEPPCTRACIVDLSQHTFFINPAMALTNVKLFIDSGTSNAQIVSITTSTQPSLTSGVSYEILLGTNVYFSSASHIYVSALANGATTAVTEQVLLAQ
jgi:hypothetical protein